MVGAVGVVPVENRGTLPQERLHGEPMFLHPVRALQRCGRLDDVVVTCADEDVAQVARAAARRQVRVTVLPAQEWWDDPSPRGCVVLADPLCPLVPPSFVARVIEEAGAGAAAGYRPVTDTVKTVVARRITGTLDRDRLAVVTSPVVVPGSLVAEAPPLHDFAVLATWLRQRGGLTLVRAPSMARRVGDESAVRVLECLDELDHQAGEARAAGSRPAQRP